jgi:urease accessory protein UreF
MTKGILLFGWLLTELQAMLESIMNCIKLGPVTSVDAVKQMFQVSLRREMANARALNFELHEKKEREFV